MRSRAPCHPPSGIPSRTLVQRQDGKRANDDRDSSFRGNSYDMQLSIMAHMSRGYSGAPLLDGVSSYDSTMRRVIEQTSGVLTVAKALDRWAAEHGTMQQKQVYLALKSQARRTTSREPKLPNHAKPQFKSRLQPHVLGSSECKAWL